MQPKSAITIVIAGVAAIGMNAQAENSSSAYSIVTPRFFIMERDGAIHPGDPTELSECNTEETVTLRDNSNGSTLQARLCSFPPRQCTADYYPTRDGECAPKPPSAKGATALCHDGFWSHSKRQTDLNDPDPCASHGGVERDVEHDGTMSRLVPYDVKVDPPICELTVVKEVYPSACKERTRHCEWREGTRHCEWNWNEDYGPGHPEDGDAWGCYGAGAGGIAYQNGKFQNGEYAYVPAMENSKIGDQVKLCLVSFMADCPRGDDRGTWYTAENVRTHGRWRKPNASHSCGGA